MTDLDEKKLRKLMQTLKIDCDQSTPKSYMVNILKQKLKDVDKKRIKKISKLGHPGKDGVVWSIKNLENGKTYALKQFKPGKPSKAIFQESEMQKVVAQHGISPNVIEIDLILKYIVMDLLDGITLFDKLKSTNGEMSIQDQKDFVKIIQKLDSIGIYHGDPSPLNFIYVGDKLKVIDFGYSRAIKHKDENAKYMYIGFILKMKEIGVDIDSNYNYIKKFIDRDILAKCNIKF